jgi:hypothetical protein
MLKSTIVALFVAAGTLTAAQNSQEVLNVLVPEAAKVVSDVNLKTIYQQALMKSMLDDVPLQDALAMVSQDLGEAGIRYTVSGSEVTAETDWSCRRLVIGDTFIRVVDC